VELIAALLAAGPLGYFMSTSKRGLWGYLILWAIVFPIQTAVVYSDNPDDINILYFVINGMILALGIILNRLGWRLRRRRSATEAAAGGHDQ
jgi:hypothetical protein